MRVCWKVCMHEGVLEGGGGRAHRASSHTKAGPPKVGHSPLLFAAGHNSLLRYMPFE